MREAMGIVTGTSCMQISLFLLNDIVINSDKYKLKSNQKSLDQILTLVLELNKIYSIEAKSNYDKLVFKKFTSNNNIIENALQVIETGAAYSRINQKEITKNNEEYFNGLKGY